MQVEVRFYYAATPTDVYYIGSTGIAVKEEKDVTLPENVEKIDNSFTLCLKSSNVPLDDTDNMQVFIRPTVNGNGEIVFGWYLGTQDVQCTLSDHEQGFLDLHEWKITLATDLLHPDELCLIFVREYLSVATNEELAQLDKDDRFLSFRMKQDTLWLPPTLVCRIIAVSKLSPTVLALYKECPPDCLVVEIIYTSRGFFCFVKKSAWKAKQVNSADIVQGQ